MKLTFFGAAGEVTGSKTILEIEDKHFLIDCGIFNGGDPVRNHQPFPFDPTKIDAVILTHAHLDHVGLLPRLVKDGFGGAIFSTAPTRELCRYLWEDAVKVEAEERGAGGAELLYDSHDIERTLKLMRDVGYGEVARIAPEVEVMFHDAGHILGSAWVEFRYGDQVVIASGDIGNDNTPILKDTELLSRADVVIMESTYGDRNHTKVEDRQFLLKQAISDVISRQSVLLIPAFSVERTQEIIYEINGLVESGAIKNVPVFLDSPLATDILPVFRAHPECYDREATILKSMGDDFFRFAGLTITRRFSDSLAIDSTPAPKVIIAGSGMMNGGRILRHLVQYLPEKDNILLVTGFQAAGTHGRQIMDGVPLIDIDGASVAVAAEVRIIDAYSAHGDRDKLLRWLGAATSKPRLVFCNHGELIAANALAETIRSSGYAKEAIVPEEGLSYEI